MKGSDDIEMIQQCLSCERKRCTNCLERYPVGRPRHTVLRIDPRTGEITAEYHTFAEAARQNNLIARHVLSAARGRKRLGGYDWDVIEEE